MVYFDCISDPLFTLDLKRMNVWLSNSISPMKANKGLPQITTPYSLKVVTIFRLHGKREFIGVIKITDLERGKLSWINQIGINLIAWSIKSKTISPAIQTDVVEEEVGMIWSMGETSSAIVALEDEEGHVPGNAGSL